MQRIEQEGLRGVLGSETRLVSTLLVERSQTPDAEHLALPLLPRVGYRGMLGGILYAHLGIALLRLADDVQPLGAKGDLDRIGEVGDIVDGIRSDVLLRVARETVYHREVALADTARRYLEVTRRTIRHVGLGVGRRLVVGRSVYAEHRKVASMARPYPVVGVAAELAYRRRRRAHQTHVVEYAVDEQILLVAVIHLLDGCGVALALGLGRGDDSLCTLSAGKTVGNILHSDKYGHLQALARQLPGARLSPVAVGQIVVVDRRERLYGVVAAMMIGQQQSLGRYDLARAASVEQHDGVFERRLVDRIDILRRETESLRAHILDARRDQRRQPHALVGNGRRADRYGQQCQ